MRTAEYKARRRVLKRARPADDPEREKDRVRVRAWSEENRERIRASSRAWALANPEKYVRGHHEATHRRRARERGQMGTITRGIYALLRRVQHGLCFHCAEPLSDSPHLDHLRPIAIGGLHDDGNVALSCAPCNLRRGWREDAGPGPLAYNLE